MSHSLPTAPPAPGVTTPGQVTVPELAGIARNVACFAPPSSGEPAVPVDLAPAPSDRRTGIRAGRRPFTAPGAAATVAGSRPLLCGLRALQLREAGLQRPVTSRGSAGWARRQPIFQTHHR